MKQAVLEHQNDVVPLNATELESEVIEEVKSDYDIYKENSFWIYHIGPEITLTILAVLLWVRTGLFFEPPHYAVTEAVDIG